MTNLGGLDVFQPFRDSSASSKVLGGRHLMSRSNANSGSNSSNSNSSNRSVQKNKGMMMMSASSSEDYSSHLSQPYPLVSSATANTESSSSVGRLGASARLTASSTGTTNESWGLIGAGSSSSLRRGSGNSSTRSSSLVRSSSKTRIEECDNIKEAQASSSSHSSNKDNDVIIEEKRRRSNGEGYTTHQYLRGRMLGKGGFAKVYLCTALDTGKNYAVKVVDKANLVKARAKQKLQAEIKIHRTLKHKHICQYKHYFEDRNHCYILLELCHNQSLNEMIKRRKRITEPEAAYFLKQLILATRYMHDVNVIHRDLKLGNLFLDKNMHVKVGDLGLATRVEDKDEKRKTICGTPNYIAPEVIQGDKAKRGHSFEVDIWSIGVILYTVLVGKPPYEAKDVKATYHRILANEYTFPSHTKLSPEVKDLIQCILRTDPKERPSLDFIEDHPFLTNNLTPEALPSSILHRAPVWQKDSFGVLVLEEQMASQHPSKSLPRSNSRQPFSSRNPNVSKSVSSRGSGQEGGLFPFTKPSSGRSSNTPSVVSSVVSSISGSSSKKSARAFSPGFKIFEESSPQQSAVRRASPSRKSTPRSPRSSKALSAETLITRTKALSVADRSPECYSPPVKTPSDVSARDGPPNLDVEVVTRMIDQLSDVLSVTNSRRGSYLSHHSPRSASTRAGPQTWVARHVDYTSKYGLGFLLNDGSAGVYFNDSTKTVLEPSGNAFLYIERKRDDNGCSFTDTTRPDVVMKTHTLSRYPENLKKKVTLLTHFRNYLIDQQKKVDSTYEPPLSTGDCSPANLVYVKKWVQTRHAVLFRLSDGTVQVVFYDQTEVLLTPDTRYITYVDKQRRRNTYLFTDELVGSSNEMEKRLKYTKEILTDLLTQRRKVPIEA